MFRAKKRIIKHTLPCSSTHELIHFLTSGGWLEMDSEFGWTLKSVGDNEIHIPVPSDMLKAIIK